MKTIKYIILLVAFFAIGASSSCRGQLKRIGYIEQVLSVETIQSDILHNLYFPKLRLLGDTLYVASNSGLYRKDLRLQEAPFELCALDGIAVVDFVKDGNLYLAMAAGNKQLNDSLLFISKDGGSTFTNFTDSNLLRNRTPWNAMFGFIQNPKNPSSLLLSSYYGIFRSFDMGANWNIWNDGPISYDPAIKYNPSDTTVVFLSGQNAHSEGIIQMIKNNESTTYQDPDFTASIPDIAFHPQKGGIVLYCGNSGIGRTVDTGFSWQKTSHESAKKLFFNEEYPDTVYGINVYRLSDEDNDHARVLAIHRSTDGGKNWTPFYYKEHYDYEEISDILDVAYYKNTLLLYSRKAGILALDVENASLSLSETVTATEATVYPNPARNIVYFKVSEAVERVLICPVSGGIIKSEKLSGSDGLIDISGIGTGMYILLFYTSDNRCFRAKISVI